MVDRDRSLPDHRDEPDRLLRALDFVADLILVVSAVAAVLFFVLFVYSSFISSATLHSTGHQDSATAASVASSGLVSGGEAPSPSAGTAPSGQTETTSKCDNFDPNTATFGEALACLVIAVGTGVASGIIAGVKILYILYVCIIIPIVALLLALLFYWLSRLLEERSRNCSRRRRWWQRLWCYVKRVLSWVLVALAVLAVIVAIISIIACLIALF